MNRPALRRGTNLIPGPLTGRPVTIISARDVPAEEGHGAGDEPGIRPPGACPLCRRTDFLSLVNVTPKETEA